MADLKTNFKITGDSKEAQKAVEELNDALNDSKKSIDETTESFEEMDSASVDAGDSVEQLADELEELGDKKSAIDSLAQSLDNFEKQAKKLGRDFTTLVTAPIAALAGISLKNLYDTGSIEGATGPAREFALVIQDLMRNFKDLSLELGQRLAPLFSSLAAGMSNLMKWFKSLDDSTKNLVINFGLMAAAIGPMILAFSSLAGIFAKLLPVLKVVGVALAGIFSVLTSPIAIITALAATLAGLTNVFLKLRKAGVDTATALNSTFNLFVSGFNNYVTKNILKGVNLIIQGLSKLAGFTGLSTKGIDAAAGYVDGLISTLDSRFDAAKTEIDANLESIGSSAGEAFTYGLSEKLSGVVEGFKSLFSSDGVGGVLESEMGKSFDSAFKKVELAHQTHLLNMEQAEFEHQQRMLEITDAMDPTERLNARLQAEEEFLIRRQDLERQALLQRVEEERKALEAIQDLNERARQERELNEKTAIEVAELTNRQELELLQLHNQQIEQMAEQKYGKLKQYADSFSSGLSNAFLEVADGTKDLGSALDDFARQFIRQMTQMILQAQIYKAVMGSIGMPSFAQGGPVGSVPAFATGGFVRGAGTGTSDSILARLSNGEFVTDAKTVTHFGVEFFQNLKRMARGGVPISPRSSIPNFADGGLVSSSSQAPQVVIENRGTPSEVVGSEFDPRTAVLTVIIDDLSKNGPASKAMQSTFSLKRGGFR